MWARWTEVLLALWLGSSPFVLGSAPGRAHVWHDVACALAVGVLALVSFHPRTSRGHLLELVVAAWLVLAGWIETRSGPTPLAQNHILVGLVLGMLAIVPSRASQPPSAWIEHEQR